MPTQLESYNASKLTPVVNPQDARTETARLGPSLTLAAGTLLGKKTSDGLLYAYANANSDGTETAVAILTYDTATDANGKHYLGDSAVASSLNLPQADCTVYLNGTFPQADLTGYDANALADFQGRVLHNGYIYIP